MIAAKSDSFSNFKHDSLAKKTVCRQVNFFYISNKHKRLFNYLVRFVFYETVVKSSLSKQGFY
jgi:hypothetical protein